MGSWLWRTGAFAAVTVSVIYLILGFSKRDEAGFNYPHPPSPRPGQIDDLSRRTYFSEYLQASNAAF